MLIIHFIPFTSDLLENVTRGIQLENEPDGQKPTLALYYS